MEESIGKHNLSFRGQHDKENWVCEVTGTTGPQSKRNRKLHAHVETAVNW